MKFSRNAAGQRRDISGILCVAAERQPVGQPARVASERGKTDMALDGPQINAKRLDPPVRHGDPTAMLLGILPGQRPCAGHVSPALPVVPARQLSKRRQPGSQKFLKAVTSENTASQKFSMILLVASLQVRDISAGQGSLTPGCGRRTM
jgi:hypothetical protein